MLLWHEAILRHDAKCGKGGAGYGGGGFGQEGGKKEDWRSRPHPPLHRLNNSPAPRTPLVCTGPVHLLRGTGSSSGYIYHTQEHVNPAPRRSKHNNII